MNFPKSSFYIGSKDTNSIIHADVASAFPIEPSSQSWNYVFKIRSIVHILNVVDTDHEGFAAT